MEYNQLLKFAVAVLVAFLFPIMSQASYAGEDPNVYEVSEKLTTIKLAPEAINRIHSREPIQKINAPRSLELEVEYQENNAFVTIGKKAKKGRFDKFLKNENNIFAFLEVINFLSWIFS